jgi:SAM-dependent methyltransferase
MKVNIGCGSFYAAGWINTDIDPEIRADIHCPMHDLPFEDESIDEIYAGHVIEHDTREMTPLIFAEWMRVLKPDGVLTVTIPDIVKAVDLMDGNALNVETFDRIAIGGDERDPQRHRRLCFAGQMASEMVRAGFREVDEVDYHHLLPAVVAWQSILSGVK